MPYLFFFASIFVLWLLLLKSNQYRSVQFESVFIGLVTVVYSLLFDIVLGWTVGLYYYIAPAVSLVYIVLAALLVYPPLNIMYTLFLPHGKKAVLLYTALWIAAMLIFEYASLKTQTIVLTGWKVFPWSPLLYLFSYGWIYPLYRYMQRRRIQEGAIL